jgi:hypothetical protein
MREIKTYITERLILSKDKPNTDKFEVTFENFYDLLWNTGEIVLEDFTKEYHYGLPIKYILGKKYSPVKIYAGREQRTNKDAVVCVLENVSNPKVTRLQYAIDLTTLVYLLGTYIVEDLIKYMQK